MLNGTAIETTSTIEVARLLSQPHQKVKQKVDALRERLTDFNPDGYDLTKRECQVLLQSYADGGRLDNQVVFGAANELGVKVVFGSTEPLPIKQTKAEPKPVNLIPEKQPKQVKSVAAERLLEKPTETSSRTEKWIWWVYCQLRPVRYFLETREGMLLLAFAAITVQAWQIYAAYMQDTASPNTLFAVVFAAVFELTGLALTVNSANRAYLFGFAILSTVINLSHSRILDVDSYKLVERIVFSCGLPFAIFSFSDRYAKRVNS